MDEKMGYVKRTPFGALKKICEEYSLSRIIGGLLRKFENLVYLAIDKINNKTSMFTKNTQQELLGEKVNPNKNLGQEILKELSKENSDVEIIM